jgi:hypothetical protein
MLEDMGKTPKEKLITELRQIIWNFEKNPKEQAGVASVRAALAALEASPTPTAAGIVPNVDRVHRSAPPSPASLKRGVPVAGHSGDPRLAKLDAIVRNALGQHKKLGTVNRGAWQFAGVPEDYNPFEGQGT